MTVDRLVDVNTMVSDIAGKAVWEIANSSDNIRNFQQLVKKIAMAQKKLTKRQQQIIYMKYTERKSQREIAKELGVSESTVSRTLKRAIQKCLEYMKFAV